MDALRLLRKHENLSQADMASVMRVSYSAYKKVENDERRPSAGFIRRFKAAFPAISADIFFTEEKRP